MPELNKEQYSKAEVLEIIRESVEKSEEKAEVAELIAGMTDVEKSYLSTLSGDAKSEFIFADQSQRSVAIEKAHSDDPVVYTAKDGSEYRKSDDPRLIQMAKDRETDREELVKAKVARESDRLEKLAEGEYKHLAGDLETRKAIIKAAEGIADETVRKSALDSLKAQAEQLEKSTQTIGAGGEFKTSDAQVELDNLAKKHQEAHPEVDYYDAYDIVATANPALHKRAVAGE